MAEIPPLGDECPWSPLDSAYRVYVGVFLIISGKWHPVRCPFCQVSLTIMHKFTSQIFHLENLLFSVYLLVFRLFNYTQNLSEMLRFTSANLHSPIAPYSSAAAMWGVWYPWTCSILSFPQALTSGLHLWPGAWLIARFFPKVLIIPSHFHVWVRNMLISFENIDVLLKAAVLQAFLVLLPMVGWSLGSSLIHCSTLRHTYWYWTSQSIV